MTRLPVRWRDLDPLGHVNYVVFLTYLEEGRNAWLRGVIGEQFGPEDYVVARVEVDLRSEIPLGTPAVEVHCELEAVGRSSVTTLERLYDDGGTLAAEARVVVVMWDSDERRARPLTECERAALLAVAGNGAPRGHAG